MIGLFEDVIFKNISSKKNLNENLDSFIFELEKVIVKEI